MMRTTVVAHLVLAAALIAAPAAGATEPAEAPLPNSGVNIDQEWVVVVLDEGSDPALVLSDEEHSSQSHFAKVRIRPGEEPEEAVARLQRLPAVRSASLNRVFGPLTLPPLHLALVPNDPYFAEQWNLEMVQAPAAWDTSRGAGVTVAVIDSGVSSGGQDLRCHTFVHEYDAASSKAGPGSALDEDGHGTHVTGTVAQCTDNGIGTAGMAPDSSVMPVKVFSWDPAYGWVTDSFAVAGGIDWARTHGADVINMSLGFGCGNRSWPDCGDAVIDAAIAEAAEDDIVLVAAAGNSHGAGQPTIAYPANHPSVIAVGAVTADRSVASYSQRGSQLSLVAPGGSLAGPGVLQETFNESGVWGFYELQGTSMAAPHVAGAAAILRSAAPGATGAQIRAALECSALDVGARGKDGISGHGLLQVASALEALGGKDGIGLCAGFASGALVDPGGRWHVFEPGGQRTFYYGNPGDIPFVGDWNCDGTDTPGVYRPLDGIIYLRNSNTEGTADLEFHFDRHGIFVPIAGDFDGDGCDTVSLYRPTTGLVSVVNALGTQYGTLGEADYDFFFGIPGDKPFVGDFDGDGIDTIGLHREGSGLVYYRNTNSQGNAEVQFYYGNPGDHMFAADWNGDGIDTVGVFRSSSATFHLRYANSDGTADEAFQAGLGSWLPVAGMFGGS